MRSLSARGWQKKEGVSSSWAPLSSGVNSVNGVERSREGSTGDALNTRSFDKLGMTSRVDASNCGNCDICLNPKELFDATVVAQKILSAVIRTGNRFGANYVVDVLRGSKKKAIVDNRHDQLSVYWIVDDFSADELKELIKSLVQEWLLEKEIGQYPTLSVSIKWGEWLKSRSVLELPKVSEPGFTGLKD